MNSFVEMDHLALAEVAKKLKVEQEKLRSQNLSLDMTRGKPCNEQLDLGADLLTCLTPDDVFSEAGVDCRNYGLLPGISESRRLFAQILNTLPEQVMVGNNSSLTLMHDTLVRALLFGELDSPKPWSKESKLKWLCPVPGYDRHFLVTETLGFELIAIPLKTDGPDMDMVEELVAVDPSIKGMWCIPLYSNPDGYIYSNEVCQRLASMKTAAPDFRILWDNAYSVHHLYENQQGSIPDILALCDKAGNPNRVYEFASTSKITFAGSGISCIAANQQNIAHISKYLNVQTIGPDKMNELRHVRYIPDMKALQAIMAKHAAIIRPKFKKTLDILTAELEGTGIASWHAPLGGYFISLYVYPGTAKKVVAMAKELGVALTPAGATYPYGKDPQDSNIRISPTYPAIADVEQAISVLCVCTKLAAVEKLLEEV